MSEKNAGSTNYGINLNNKGLTRGQGRKFVSFAGRNTIIPRETGYNYRTGIVTEVISDPKSYFSNQTTVTNFYKELEQRQLNDEAEYSSEQNLIHKIPKNSIICKLIDDSESLFSDKNVVCFPFFSPHISIPIKPGEHVWIMEELFDDFPRYYWVSRKHSAYYNDNLNLTSHEREISIYSNTNLSSGINAFTDETVFKMHNFPNRSSNNDFLLSKARKKELTNEPVPEIAKKCGDLLLQGSNNALIHMTTEKFTPAEAANTRYAKDLFANGAVGDDDTRTPLSPAIDICVLRKKKHLLALAEKFNQNKQNIIDHSINEKDNISIVENTRQGRALIENYEINKFNEDYYSNKDSDPSNCGARIYMSNNCNIDAIFNIADTELSQEIFQQYSGATLTGYSEHIRLIAEGESSSFRVVKKHSEGETFLEIDNAGIVNIGSKEGNVSAQSGGKSGLQPFVRGDDLHDMLALLIDQIFEIALTIQINAVPGVNVSPGFGGPNGGLVSIGTAMADIITALGDIQIDLPKFKSSLIKGE